ncbi:MAG: polysaccharide pyruvyl transferase family protein [Trichloromonas sp.]|jgi:polysaccharide pyruvyl transferase WcaK-like protein|nr:polysaccharide pyruvyl transferase family protein [Trichloromonas sp.]
MFKAINRLILSGLLIIIFTNYSYGKVICGIKKEPVILIVSGWQSVNIGDIAHTPGLLHLIEQHIPEAKIILWKVGKSEMVVDLLKKNFPKVEIIHGNPDNNMLIDSVMNVADLFIHGSGPYMVASKHIKKWMSLSDKPFGFFGVTFENPSNDVVQILKKASFIFPRDTESIQHLKKVGIEGKHVIFGPDATFALHIRDDNKAQDFMKKHSLKEKEFLCIVNRLRITPYWWAHPNYISEEEIKKRNEINEKWKYDDHAKLCDAITYWVRNTKKPVVICPEMDYQLETWDELIIDKLPEDVKPFIIKHDYWLPDEAISLYQYAYSLISMECHSVIMALVVGTPVFYLRQPQDTIKGQMFYDLLLSRWVFEIEKSTGEQISNRLSEIINDYPGALKYLRNAHNIIDKQYQQCFKIINKTIR